MTARPTFDRDYGPPTAHSLDPRNDADDAPPFDAMDREQRERFVDSLDVLELRALCVSLGDDLDQLELQLRRQGTRASGVFAV